MYSILPAVVSMLFLGYGFFALASRGINRISASFFALCITTFFWQFTWSILFQINEPAIALLLIKLGYFFIIFLPTTLYHFLTEICGRYEERRYVYFSYAVSAVFAAFLLSSELFVSGYYRYFFGYYPKAGLLHPVYLLQTLVIVNRGLYITYCAQKHASGDAQMRQRLCLAGLLIFFFAAIDYLCNYGFEFYPPGVMFIPITLYFFTVAIKEYDLFNPMALAATIAHEMRTPLANIRIQAVAVSQYWPILFEGYQLAVNNGLMKPRIRNQHLKVLSDLAGRITHEVDKSNAVIDMMLASASMERPETVFLERYFIGACIAEALERYPFDADEKRKIVVTIEEDFEFQGSDTLLVFVLFNLLKNSIYALKKYGKGEIHISTKTTTGCNILYVTDTGPGIPKKELPYIFDSFSTSKRKDGGTGIGLSFCKKVMTAFNGSITCDSKEGEYTTFVLEFPTI